MDTQEMKKTFLFRDKEQAQIMLEYLRNNLGISDAEIWNYIGYYVLDVNPIDYERALRGGKKYACENDWCISWINHYDETRSPIASSDIGYAVLPQTLIPGEEKEKYSKRMMWDFYDKSTPKTILEYFYAMKRFLKATKIIRTYKGADAFIISPLSLDYEKKSQLFQEFVARYGYGPFEEIRPVTFTGEVKNEPMYVRKIR